MGKPVVPVSSVLILQEIELTWIRPGLDSSQTARAASLQGSPFIFGSPLLSPSKAAEIRGPATQHFTPFLYQCMLIERQSQRDGGGSGDDDDANDGGDTAAHTPKP